MDVRRIRFVLSGALCASGLLTLLLLLLDGRWQEAIPLHLCSIAAVCAVFLSLRPRRFLLDFLWYLGMPGALLALLFPAPAISRFQTLMNASFAATHLLILLIPLLLMCMGMRPGSGQGIKAFFFMQAAALCAALVNHLLGTDFLFLSAPPSGTPLEFVFALGSPVYLIALESTMLLICLAMDALARRCFGEKKRNEEK